MLSSRADGVYPPDTISTCRPLDAKLFDRCRHRKGLPFRFFYVAVGPLALATAPASESVWVWVWVWVWVLLSWQ
jgi:hypothetical protein